LEGTWRLHRRLQLLHWRILASADLLRRIPLLILFVLPQNGHLWGLPLGIFFTSDAAKGRSCLLIVDVLSGKQKFISP
jgi:hypothetical protein